MLRQLWIGLSCCRAAVLAATAGVPLLASLCCCWPDFCHSRLHTRFSSQRKIYRGIEAIKVVPAARLRKWRFARLYVSLTRACPFCLDEDSPFYDRLVLGCEDWLAPLPRAIRRKQAASVREVRQRGARHNCLLKIVLLAAFCHACLFPCWQPDIMTLRCSTSNQPALSVSRTPCMRARWLI